MTVTDLFSNQVDSLLAKVRRAVAANGADAALTESIRTQVAGELLNRGQLHVVQATIGELIGEPGCEWLRDLVTHSKENFYAHDKVLSMVVVPVSVRIKSHFDGELRISTGGRSALESLGRMMERCLGYERVVFDRRIYDGHAVFYRNAQKLLKLGQDLLAGVDLPDTEIKSTEIVSKVKDERQMVYFIGVAVTGRHDERHLNDDDVQRHMMRWRCHAERAITESKEVLSNPYVARTAKCHGLYYLDKGVRLGEDLIRGDKLDSFLGTFEQGGTGVSFYWTTDQKLHRIRLLAVSGVSTAVFDWPRYAFETSDGFLAALSRAIDLKVPADDVIALEEVDAFDFEALMQKYGRAFE